jgi:hypothetical protein
MIEPRRNHIPEDHPIRAAFHALTERGMKQMNLRDLETIQYITNLLTDFVPIENMNRVKDASGQPLHYLWEMLERANEPMPVEQRRDYNRRVGDLILFNLGLFPGSLTYGRRTVSPSFYAARGRYSYSIAASMDPSRNAQVYEKLAEQFQQYVGGLNWVKVYINDPFYQYMLRQFHVT